MKRRDGTFSVILLVFVVFPALICAQSGRKANPPTPEVQNISNQKDQNLESIKILRSNGFGEFVKQLNDLGRNGYRLEKAVNYGGEGASQSFAAVLRLKPGDNFEYDWLSSPNKNLLESRLNFKAKDGFNFASSFALTACSDSEEDVASSTTLILRLQKGDAFLVERKNGQATQTKEYKVLVGKIGPGRNPTEAIQTSLDNVPAGFRPVKILFSKTGIVDFAVSILLERTIDSESPTKIEYKFIKEVNGFDKTLNALAAQGYRIISGRRVGLVKLALLAKETTDPTTYTLIDEEKYAKQFDDTVSRGNKFELITGGDLTCGSTTVENEKMVFEQNKGERKYEYKILQIIDPAADELNTSLANGFSVKDLFYYRGLNAILEK